MIYINLFIKYFLITKVYNIPHTTQKIETYTECQKNAPQRHTDLGST
jgi:hypothetical protein